MGVSVLFETDFVAASNSHFSSGRIFLVLVVVCESRRLEAVLHLLLNTFVVLVQRLEIYLRHELVGGVVV